MNLMSIGSCCASMGVMNNDRIKGPVDNMRSLHGISDCIHLLNGDLLDIVKNNKYIDRTTKSGEIRNNLIYYNNIHFDINTHKNEFYIRYNNLFNFIKQLDKTDNYLIYTLSKKDIKDKEFVNKLNELGKYIPLNKLIIIGGRSNNPKWWYQVELDYKLDNYVVLENIYKWSRDKKGELI